MPLIKPLPPELNRIFVMKILAIIANMDLRLRMDGIDAPTYQDLYRERTLLEEYLIRAVLRLGTGLQDAELDKVPVSLADRKVLFEQIQAISSPTESRINW